MKENTTKDKGRLRHIQVTREEETGGSSADTNRMVTTTNGS